METVKKIALLGVLAGASGSVLATKPTSDAGPTGPADAIVERIVDPELKALLDEVLERNPELDALRARAAATGERRIAATKLPDPRAELTAFILPPETRVGPQRAAVRVTQVLPGGGKRDLSARIEELQGEVLAAELEALRLRLVTETRTQAAELGYLDQALLLLEDELATLERFEELARGRYESGFGLQMDAIQIQTELTRLEVDRSDLAARRALVEAELNRLRDRPAQAVPAIALRPVHRPRLAWPELRETALANRPELAAADAEILRSTTVADLSAKRGSPDFSVGLTYAWVDQRTDVDVPDNGRDVLGLNGGLTIPLWGGAVDAEVEAATQLRLAEEAGRRSTVATIQRELEGLRGRIPELVRRLDLLERVLPIQAEQALASAEAAYVAGRVDALALVDAERTLIDVRLSAARARTDLLIALIALEGAIAAPLPSGASS